MGGKGVSKFLKSLQGKSGVERENNKLVGVMRCCHFNLVAINYPNLYTYIAFRKSSLENLFLKVEVISHRPASFLS